MESVDCLVVGAGVVGIAVARSLAAAGRDVVVVDAASCIGSETSSRNSEVIHAGIYYRKDSLMARTCVEGRRRLYAFCEQHGVPHRRCGKLIVATSGEEAEQLAAIKARAEANGVEGLRMLSASQARAMEPEVDCTAAILSPETGIVDSHAYMVALQGDAENDGAVFAFHSPVEGGRATEDGIEVAIGGDAPMKLRANTLVNAAGLHAPALAGKLEGMPADRIPKSYFAKGHYFTLQGRTPFTHLVYPVPVPGGLGIHLTLDMGGRARFGPDVHWIEDIDYDFDASRSGSFYAAIRRYWPELRDGALQPGYCGIRPKIVPKGAPAQDFLIQGARDHGVRGLVNLFGIESPGLTAAILLADIVREMA